MTRVFSYCLCVVLLLLPAALVISWTGAAKTRLKMAQDAETKAPIKIAVAEQANESYCTPALKKILRRVLQSCGLLHGRAGRGCKPMDAKNVATMSDDDFNALFVPMLGRGGIIQFDQGKDELELIDNNLIETVFSKRLGASYFFVVARASPEGSVVRNRELSRKRAEGVLAHLKTTFNDVELERQVGLLWLGEEYAQLDPTFCKWQRSGPKDTCTLEDLNRSAFITWIDCQL